MPSVPSADTAKQPKVPAESLRPDIKGKWLSAWFHGVWVDLPAIASHDACVCTNRAWGRQGIV